MDITKIVLFAQVAGDILKIGSATIADIRAMQSAGVDLDESKLAQIEADYAARIARRQNAQAEPDS